MNCGELNVIPDAIDCIVAVAAAVVAVAVGHLTFPYGAVVGHYCAFDTGAVPFDVDAAAAVAVAVVVAGVVAAVEDEDVSSL